MFKSKRKLLEEIVILRAENEVLKEQLDRLSKKEALNKHISYWGKK